MRSHSISQQKLSEKPLDISLFSEKLTDKEIETLHWILSFNKIYKSMYFSQKFIGSKLRRAQQTVSGYFNSLDDSNLVIKFHRGRHKTIEYVVNPQLLEQPYLDKLKSFFNDFFKFFTLSLILSSPISAVRRESVQLIKEVYLYNCTSTVQKRTSINEEILLYEYDPTWYYQACTCTGCTTEAVPNKKRTLLEFEALFKKEQEQYMQAFTEEQLIVLAQYPKASLEYAQKMLTRDMAAGKGITNIFSYFHAICKKHAEKNPQTGKTKSSPSRPRPSSFTEYVEGGKWIPGARIINNDRNYQTTITHVETDIEWALNYEKSIHHRTINDPEFAKRSARFDGNPLWNKFSPEQQQDIWIQAHVPSCTCRTNEQAGTILPDVAKQLAAKFT